MVEELKQQISVIDWFSNVGGGVDLALSIPISRVKTWASAAKVANGRKWENTQLQARGDFTAWLTTHHQDQYQGVWNDLIDRHKSQTVEPLAEEVLKPLLQQHGLDEGLLHSIKWDVLAALMEASYAEKLKHPFDFSRQLVQIYAGGHFPCGWEGNYPSGSLIVY